MAEKVRIDRKDLKGPDPFFEAIGELRKSAAENRTTVIAAVATVVVLFLGVVAMNSYRSSRAESAAAGFFRATESVEADSLEAAKTGFAYVAKDGTKPYSNLAVLYGADLAVREERWDDAIELYKGFAGLIKQDYLKQIGWKGYAYSLEMAGDTRGASGAYAKAAEFEGPYREEALRNRVRTADKLGDKAAADAAAAKLLALFPDSEEADSLNERLAASE